MKKLNFIIMILVALAFAGCENTEDPNKPKEPSNTENPDEPDKPKVIDFGIATWGDHFDYVCENETKDKIGWSLSLLEYQEDGKDIYSYRFDDNRLLDRGEIDMSNQFHLNHDYPNQYLIVTSDYMSVLSDLMDEFGDPIDKTIDVYSLEYDEHNPYTPGHAIDIVMKIIRGDTRITYEFKNDRTFVEATLRSYRRDDKKENCAYTIFLYYEQL